MAVDRAAVEREALLQSRALARISSPVQPLAACVAAKLTAAVFVYVLLAVLLVLFVCLPSHAACLMVEVLGSVAPGTCHAAAEFAQPTSESDVLLLL